MGHLQGDCQRNECLKDDREQVYHCQGKKVQIWKGRKLEFLVRLELEVFKLLFQQKKNNQIKWLKKKSPRCLHWVQDKALIYKLIMGFDSFLSPFPPQSSIVPVSGQTIGMRNTPQVN